MFKIINKLILGRDIKRLDVEAPDIARTYHPGQFVMVCPEARSKWIPLTIVEADTRRGIITIIVQETGSATRLLGALPIHDEIFSVSGPFGTLSEPRQVGTIVCAASGIGAAQLIPVCRAYGRVGNKVIGVLGASTRAELILETQMRIACHKIFLTTEDGSYQRRGSVAEAVKEVLNAEDAHLVYSIGDVGMMREIAAITAEQKIPNLIQVHTGVSCGRGLCASCRIKVGEKLVMGCEEGPEFDGHAVDFDYLQHRMAHSCSHDSQEPLRRSKGRVFWKTMLGLGQEE